MARLQSTVVMPQNTVRRADRARKAKDTINKVIPELLRSSPRARHGVHGARLTKDPSPVPNAATSQESQLHIRLQDTDTLTAARRLTQSSRRASVVSRATATGPRKVPNVCVLNMASPVRPGGGFFDGATSQEEFLCMRTTLYPSLWDDFYRLPEVGGVTTPDVLVFRDSTPDAEELGKRDRFFVDVITAAMIRFPGINNQRDGDEDKTGCTCGVSYCDTDRDLVTRKMSGVLRMAQAQGAERLVLGAWGCGTYGNPPKEVAKIWKRVLCGTSRKAETWSGIKEIVFAINDRSILKEFERCFSDVLVPATESVSPPSGEVAVSNAEKETSDQVTELVLKIQETETQLDQISNPRSKARLRDVLADLNKQLSQVGAGRDSDDETLLDVIDEDDIDLDGVQNSDPEDPSYYHFDEDDIASSGSLSPASTFEFRYQPTSMSTSPVTTRQSTRFPSMDDASFARQKLEESDGWFSGSINGLSALLAKTKRLDGSPDFGPESTGTGEIEELKLDEYVQRFASQEA